MHQHPRGSPAPARPELSNSPRTNSLRHQELGHTRAPSDPQTPGEQGIGATEGTELQQGAHEASTARRDNMAKLSQVVQNYHTKAALIVLQSRVTLPPAYTKDRSTKRVNKWFNIELDETEAYRDEIRTWKNCDITQAKPPPMIIEIYIDTADLTNNQSLVILDDQGKRWDVEESLKDSRDKGNQSSPRVVLERWHIQLGDQTRDFPPDLGSLLPKVYKNSIVLFRSLYAYAKLLPTWKLGKKLSKSRSSTALPKLKYRILDGWQAEATNDDQVSVPLFESAGRVADEYHFGTIDSPAGPFSVSVTYRMNCDLQIEDSEALLSSHFVGLDEELFEPSLGHQTAMPETQLAMRARRRSNIGSLPPATRELTDLADPGQAYGSLSSFHHMGTRVSSSPLTALRAAREMNAHSPDDSPPARGPPDHRSVQGSRSSLRSTDGAILMGRRPSVTFSPFKSPSLSASPLPLDAMLSPRGSAGRTSTLSTLAEARRPPSSAVPSSLPARSSPVAAEVPATQSVSSSPRPAPARYSSSFSHRRGKLSVGGSKTDDDNNSSGKASLTSSAAAQPGSGVLAEAGAGSSSSIHTDDDNISDFLKMLDKNKDLRSFRPPADRAQAEVSMRRTNVALSKYQRMRDSNAVLSDSMSSSLLLQRSSSSSSRQLSSVPPMVAGTSMSISSSPGERMSPRTPHTPAIPSRLSANSIIEYSQRERGATRHRFSEGDELRSDDMRANERTSGTGAIDIPTSPRPYQPSYRRSSSVAQQQRHLPIDDDVGDVLPFGQRSASLGDGEEREPLRLSTVLGPHESSDAAARTISRPTQRSAALVPPTSGGLPMDRQQSTSQDGYDDDRPPSARGLSWRPRIGRGGGRGFTSPPASSNSPTGDRGSNSGSSDQRGGRYSFTRVAGFEDDEPLLFAMSDFGQTRRSIEDARRTVPPAAATAAASDRGSGDSTASSQRGGRRGGPSWT